jgi:hypothetical protein
MTMSEDLWDWFVSQPERILTAGAMGFGSGSILLVFGAELPLLLHLKLG